MTLAKEIIRGNECGRAKGLEATDSVLLGLNNSVLIFGLILSQIVSDLVQRIFYSL